jgi:hypothetical protein
MATQPNPALEAAVADLMGLALVVDAAASAKEALSHKCPRVAPSSEPVLPMMGAEYWSRRAVENAPHMVSFTCDGKTLAYVVGASVSAAQAKASGQRVAA